MSHTTGDIEYIRATWRPHVETRVRGTVYVNGVAQKGKVA